jgi:hypothetical protein
MNDDLEHAVDLLRRRLGDVVSNLAALDVERSRIEAALRALAGEEGDRDASRSVPVRASSVTSTAPAPKTARRRRVTTSGRPAVKHAVVDLVEADNRSWTIAELVERLEKLGYVFTPPDPTSPVRTALWALRQDGRVRTDDESRTIAVKWSPLDSEKDSGDPEGSPEQPTNQTSVTAGAPPEGGDGSGGNRDRDYRPAAVSG